MSLMRLPQLLSTSRVALGLSAAVLVAICGQACAQSATAPDMDPKVAGLRSELRSMVIAARDKVFPALVNISVETVSYWDGVETKGGSTGSGTIISKEGYIVTNQHVTADGKKFRVTLADKQEIPARLVGEDAMTDLAVLQLDLKTLKDASSLPTAEWGDSDALTVGDTVMAMGSPFSLSRSVTLGIVSNNARVFTAGFGTEETDDMTLDDGQSTGMFTRWIQHDAAINPGNSGGPLVDLNGRVIGVNELGGSQMGFAIPATLAREVAEALIKDGEVKRSSIGMALRPIAKTGYTEGVLINTVYKEGPASRAGLQAGDLITAINGKAVTVKFAEELPPIMHLLSRVPIGGEVSLDIKRGGEAKSIKLTTEKLLRDKGDQAALRGWGISVQEITEKLMRDHRLTSSEGVFVSGVKSGGPADLAEPKLQSGDVIKSIDKKPMKSFKDSIDLYRAVMRSDIKREEIPEFLLVEFDRNGKNQVTVIKPRPDKKEDPPREVPKAWLAVATQPVVKDLARQLGHGDKPGFRVTRIYPGTQAAASELKVGDVIVAVNGEKVSPKGMQDAGSLQRKIRSMKADEKATISVLRPGEGGALQPVDVSVQLERTRIDADEARRDANKDFELNVRELTFFDRDDERWDDSVQGVLVEGSERLGWAGAAGVRGGDLIQRINDQPVPELDTYRKVMAQLAKDQPSRVIFVVLRDNRVMYRYAEPEWKAKTKEEAKAEEAKGDAKK
ncbi:MAG: PDZ domain-containing protein [Planctomycetota bacterium]|nr:PDZ domain-containing protein [Planctomycetota bacterium]